MSPQTCADVTLAIMASADGEKSLLPADLVTAHLENCTSCRQEAEQLNTLAKLLERQKRREPSADLWPAIREQLGSASAATAERKWPAFLALGLLLVIYKLLEMIPERDLGLLFKLVPLLFVIAAFGYVKENPFKINLELTLEGDR
jgi:predicted anti-sigma-YlaC factor YlaD